LDVARFAESSGFEHDYDRTTAFHYRDFVIRAFNSDMPFDQFARWQVAGDEFDPGQPLALMATGFLGAGVFPTQITANEVERTRYDALDDMLATTGTAMLGLTIGCARCHDHKFDPIGTQDYYRMLSTFTTTVRSEVELDLEPELNRKQADEFERVHAPLVRERERYEAQELPGRFERWLASGAELPSPPVWQVLEAESLRSKAGATFTKLEDGSYLATGKNAETDVYTLVAKTSSGSIGALRLEALAHPSMVKGGPGRAPNGNIGLSRIRVFMVPEGGRETNEVTLVRPRATFEQNTGSLSVASALDDNPKTGWAVDPKFGQNHAALFEFAEPAKVSGNGRLIVRLDFELNGQHQIGRPRFSVSEGAGVGLDGEGLPAAIAATLSKVKASGAASLSAEERSALLSWWRPMDPGWRLVNDRVESHAKTKLKPKLTKVLVCAEGFPAVRMHTQGGDFLEQTHFLHRGSTDAKRGVASQDFPSVLKAGATLAGSNASPWSYEPPAGAKFSGRRRVLANWMTDVNQGAGHLLARVIVNRLWQHHFGTGLVSTPNDFGAQGAKPSHPELLDWLASELIRGGWRLKPIHELLMTSQIYQQATGEDAAKRKADPSNELLSRWVSRRLEAESIRDSMLYVSGALDLTLYGAGTLDSGSRRRSVYFTVKRSQMIPVMQTFDAPEPLVSQGSRPTTTVAPQALWMMNSPQVRSWAEAFAGRLGTLGASGGRGEDAVIRAYALALNRRPTRSEREDAIQFMDAQTARYRAEGVEGAEWKARVDYAQVMLSLNEFIYVD